MQPQSQDGDASKAGSGGAGSSAQGAAGAGDAGRVQRRAVGGIVHSYQRYDPTKFPSPTAEPDGSLANAAMEHMLEFGSLDGLTEEQLANAIRLDPSMFPRLGPSLGSIERMLRERRAKILATYETNAARDAAGRGFADAAGKAEAPGQFRDAFERAVRERQIRDLERLWYRQRQESSPFAKDLLRVIEALSNAYEIDAMADRYAFTGRTELDVAGALEVKAELEAIDELLKQIEEAKTTARLAIVDMDALEQFADPDAVAELNEIARQIQEHVREMARQQGLEKAGEGLRLTPKAMRIFQRSVLALLFAELQASRSGRHDAGVSGDGPVETSRTRPFEFGDSASQLDIGQSIVNAAAREVTRAGGRDAVGGDAARPMVRDGAHPRVRVRTEDLEVHRTRVNPMCATAVLIDMSGSMRHGGQYVNSKRMALALESLIRTEFPGDYLALFEVATTAALVPVGEVPALMPKPVSIRTPVVRLKADMSDPDVLLSRLPQHFTNLQHGMRLARRVLALRDTPNRQIIMITDGLPTAHFEGSELFMLYPPDPRTERETMREAAACAREGITINVFLVPSWSQSSEDIAFAHRLAESTRGRVFFTAGRDVDRFVVWDYVSNRRRILG
jgi:uncharacterized protein with von Willebrand factor type A (vWA) domain